MLTTQFKFKYDDRSAGTSLEGETTDDGIVLYAEAPGDGPCFDRGYKRIRVEIPQDQLQELYNFLGLAIKKDRRYT